MQFDEAAYWAFLPLAWLLIRFAPARLRLSVLCLLSYAFYAAWDWRFLGLIVLSTVTDFIAAQRIADSTDAQNRNRWFALSLVVNLGALAAFKYLGFFVDSAGALLSGIGLDTSTSTLQILLPVGISFYTFQTISYTFDVWRGDEQPERSLATFGAFVSFFPQLVAGPIERSRHLIPQLRSLDARITAEQFTSAMTLFAIGLFKKVAIADQVAPVADAAFDDPAGVSAARLAIGVVAFSLQIYGDFSGYTDMARGSARFLGVELRRNFDRPYLSLSITDFWRRWHVSLSDWLRDYLYIPLGGNRNGLRRTQRNLLVTMLLGGLWHGANWTFVVWGLLHGFYLLAERTFGFADASASRARQAAGLIRTTMLVGVAWIFFRAASIGDAWTYVIGLVTLRSGGLVLNEVAVVAAAALLTILHDLARPHSALFVRSHAALGLATGLILGTVTLVSDAGTEPFIYFQF